MIQKNEVIRKLDAIYSQSNDAVLKCYVDQIEEWVKESQLVTRCRDCYYRHAPGLKEYNCACQPDDWFCGYGKKEIKNGNDA